MIKKPIYTFLAIAIAPLLCPQAQAATITWDQTAGFSALTNFVSQGEWNTAGDQEGWNANNFIAGSATVSSGNFSGVSGSPPPNPNAVDPFISLVPTAALDLTSGDHDIIEFSLRLGDGVTSFDPVRVDVFWGTNLTPGFAGTRRITIDSTSLTGWNSPAGSASDGVFHTYQVDMSGTAGWDGTLSHLRLDPIAGNLANGQKNQPFAFDYARLSTIPEPGSIMLSGLAGVALLLRRRR